MTDDEPGVPTEPSRSVPTRGRRRVFTFLALLLPFVLLLLLEGGLRLFGFGQSHPLFVPVAKTDDYLRVNRQVVRRFVVDESKTPNLWIRPVYFERRKGPETLRIFVQGGSTAEGYPYGYGASPAGMLQQRLQRTFPERKIEVVTTAMSAVTSYTLLDFSEEILEQEPDAVIIYAGHNEYVGVLGVGSGYSVGRLRPVVLSFLRARETRIFQLGQSLLAALAEEKAAKKEKRNLMATIVAEKNIPYGSALYKRGLEQYRANLRALLKRYRKAGVPVFIGTVVSNERDQPPFVDASGAGEHFRRGRELENEGRYPEAREAYLAAKDRDELRFRAPEEINVILREVAAEQGAHVVEVREAFSAAARNGIVGYDLMLEHLHPNVDGYFVMADAFYEALREEVLSGGASIPREVARQEIPLTEVDRLYGEWRIQGLMSDWPFTERKKEFRLPPATTRIEEIAHGYYRGRYEWPDAMRYLLHYYRRAGDFAAAAQVAVLVADAFPNDFEDQKVAVQVLQRARRPEAGVYRRRAERIASRQRPR